MENGFGSEFGPIIRRTCRTFFHCPSRTSSGSFCWRTPDQGFIKFTNLHAYEKEKADALKLWHANLRNIIAVKSPRTFWRTLPDGSEDGKLPGVWQKKNSPPGF